MSRIDAPRLYRLSIILYDHNDTPELEQFISRTPRFGAYDEARLIFYDNAAQVRLQSQSDHGVVEVQIICGEPDRQLSCMAQICNLALHPLLTMDNLYFEGDQLAPLLLSDGIENTNWLDLLLPFTAVKNLYLSEAFWSYIAPVLQELTRRRLTEVLPTLQNIFLKLQPWETAQEGIAEFISARQLINRPVAISDWD